MDGMNGSRYSLRRSVFDGCRRGKLVAIEHNSKKADNSLSVCGWIGMISVEIRKICGSGCTFDYRVVCLVQPFCGMHFDFTRQ